MLEGVRQHIREDLDVVYYYRVDLDDHEDDAGWYLENSASRRRVGGPYLDIHGAWRAVTQVPGGVCRLGFN